jgi:hypothetical protein
MHCIPYSDKEVVMHPAFYPTNRPGRSVFGSLIYEYTPRFGFSSPRVAPYMVRRPVTIKLVHADGHESEGAAGVTRKKASSANDTSPEPTIAFPEDAVAFGGHHYKVFWEQKTWTEAKEACAQKGGHLVCVGTDEERAFLANLKGRDKVVWIGAQRVDSGTWKWLDGTSLDPSDLGRKAPSQCDYVALHKKATLHARPVNGHDDRYPVKDVEGYVCEWDE